MSLLPRTVLVLALVAICPACLSTRAGQRVSTGMTGAELRRAVGEPYSQVHSVTQGVATDVWLFREVANKASGRKVIRDTAVKLRDGRVVEVSALKETAAEEAALSAASVLGGS